MAYKDDIECDSEPSLLEDFEGRLRSLNEGFERCLGRLSQSIDGTFGRMTGKIMCTEEPKAALANPGKVAKIRNQIDRFSKNLADLEDEIKVVESL